MQTVTSADGTTIGFERAGSGPHLVLVHGTSATLARWAAIRPLLEPHFTVTAIDRRGRGISGDADAYAIEREFEDIAAVVDACGAPVFLFGHSYGATIALGAAALTSNVAALLLYEAPVFEGSGFQAGMVERLETLLAEDDSEGVLTVFAKEIVRMPPADFVRFRSSPAWPARIEAAHTLPRELKAVNWFKLASVEPTKVTAPTLLVHGADSPAVFVDATARIAKAMPRARTAALEGQQHIAMDTAPEMLTKLTLDFWRETHPAA